MTEAAGVKTRKPEIQYNIQYPIDTSTGLLRHEEVEYVLENGVEAWELELTPETISQVTIMDKLEAEFSGGERARPIGD